MARSGWRLGARVMAAAVLLAPIAVTGGCKRAFEVATCQSASAKACDKWFVCWPVASAVAWGSLAGCKSSLRDWCTETDGCDLDDAALAECNNSVADSDCGSLPASCQDIESCYDETH